MTFSKTAVLTIKQNGLMVWLLWALGLTLLLAAPASFAVERAATVLFSQGSVTAISQNSSRPLNKGDDIVAGDTINTGANGRIQMRFTDGGLVSLTPNSSFAVEEYTQPSANSEGSLSFGLIKGGLRTLSGSIGKTNPSNYQMKTPVATLGIRGTQFIVQIDGEITRVHVGEGGVYLFNEFGELDLDAGDSAEVEPGKAPKFSQISPQITAAGTGGDGADDDDDEGGDDNPASDINLAQNLPLDGVLGDDDAAKMAAYRQLAYSGSTGTLPYSWLVTFGSGAVEDMPSILLPNFLSGGVIDVADTAWDSEIKDGAVTIGSFATSDFFDPNERWALQLYAYGQPATGMPVLGTLSYSLSESTPVYMTGGSMPDMNYQLNYFNLNIVLGTSSMSSDVSMGVGSASSSIVTFEGASSSSASTLDGALQFSYEPNAGSNCDSMGCTLGINGWLIGSNANQAGITYSLNDGNDTYFSGAASLTKTSSGGSGGGDDIDDAALAWVKYIKADGDTSLEGPYAFLADEAGSTAFDELDTSGAVNASGTALWWGDNFHGVQPADGADFEYQAYVFGEESTDIAINSPLTGQLKYSLIPGQATPVQYYNTWDGATDSYQLQKFDLDIDLGLSVNQAQVAMQIVGDNPNDVVIDFEGAGDFGTSFGTSARFDFWATGDSGTCSGCDLEVSGILSGERGAHAGITYSLNDSDYVGYYTGAAVLEKDGANLGN